LPPPSLGGMRPSPRAPAADAGYALVAAVVAVAAFAYLALQVLAVGQGGMAVAEARVRQARLAAAADAGMALAVHGLGADDRGGRWAIDGRSQTREFDGAVLTITVEDERGKAPLGQLDDAQARALFAGAGAAGETLDRLVAEFRDWRTDPATGGDSNASRLPPSDARTTRHGPMVTVGDLGALPDMTRPMFARIAPAVTVFVEDNGRFEARRASALARAAMNGDSLANPQALENQAAIDRQVPEIDLADESLIGRILSIRVVARDRGGAQTHRTEIVEFTGDPANPYWVRYAE
jgi:general secretion pathway protein K